MRACLRIAGAALVVLALVVLAGWRWDRPTLTTIFPGSPPMSIDGAACFLLLGAGLLALAAKHRTFSRVLAALAAGWSLVVIVQHAVHAIQDVPGAAGGYFSPAFSATASGRMQLSSAIAMLLSTAAVWGLAAERPSRRWLQIAGGMLLGLVLVVFLSRAAGLDFQVHWSRLMAPPLTALAFGCVAFALFAATWQGARSRETALSLGAAAAVLVGAMGLFSVRSNSAFIAANAWVNQSLEMRAAIRLILLALYDADAHRRSFNAAADERFAAAVHEVADQIRVQTESVEELSADNPRQLAQARRLRALVERKLASIDELLEARRRGTAATSERAEGVRQTLALTAAVRALADEMLKEEQQLLRTRSAETEAVGQQTHRLLIFGAGFTVVLVLLALALIRTSERARRAAEEELLVANRELQAASARALESTRLKAQFLANMSHEIRTPMNGVVGMISLLLDSPLTAEQRMLANTVRTSADALLTVLNDILDFSKIEAGQLVFEAKPFDLREPVDNCLSLLAERAHQKGLELAYLIEENVPTQLVGDAGRLHQILVNLVGNAVKFTAAGEVVLRIEKLEERERRARLKFSVRDTGPGIDPATQARLFQPFVQADGSTARRFGGTGLGLAISRQLAQLMGGDCGVQSAVGRGATFWFTVELPLQDASPRVVAPKPELAGRRALVVDDNETNREILRQQLAQWRIETHCVTNSEEALAALSRAVAEGAPFDVALLDMQMPGSSGYDLACAMQADPRFAATRRLLLTSMGTMVGRTELERGGIGATLVKPARQAQLHEALLALLAGVSREPRAASGAPFPTAAPADLKLRILVAEDNLVNQHVAQMLLAKLGYEPVIVNNGEEAVAAVQAQPFDLVFMDCQMPAVDGFEATRQIRAWEADRQAAGETFAPLHIIALTANAMIGDRDACFAAGMNDYLAKPIRMPELAAAIARTPAALG